METVIYFIVIGLLFYFMMKGCCGGGGHKHTDSEKREGHEGHGETKVEEKKKGCC